MIRIAIVENDCRYQQQLQKYVKRYSEEMNEPISTVCFENGYEILEHYKAEYDMILMDIDMPFMDGLSAAAKIRTYDTEVIIIFITNLGQYAIKGYAVNALDYVLKPISYFAFSQYLDRAVERLKNRSEDHYIIVDLKNGVNRQKIEDIYYIESQNHSLIFHTKNGEYTAPGKISKMETILVPYGFCRIHSGYLTNLNYVEQYRDGFVTVGKDLLPVSRSRKKEFMESLLLYSEGGR